MRIRLGKAALRLFSFFLIFKWFGCCCFLEIESIVTQIGNDQEIWEAGKKNLGRRQYFYCCQQHDKHVKTSSTQGQSLRLIYFYCTDFLLSDTLFVLTC